MYLKQLTKVIKKLNDEQNKSVKDIGFGSILEFKLNKIEGRLSRFLVEKFDISRCSLNLGRDEIIFTEDDVDIAMGFPRGNIAIKEGVGGEKKEYEILLREWQTRWGITTGTPKTFKMGEELIKRNDSGDWFKRDFVVMVVTCLIRGNVNESAYYKILYSLMDVKAIKDLNWCAYTFDSLIRGILKWNKKPGKFTGPLTFLLFTYLDRVVFKGQHLPKTIPVMHSWTTKSITKRVNEEIEAGGFGRGLVVPRQVLAESSHSKGLVEKLTDVVSHLAASMMQFEKIIMDIGQPQTATQTLRRTSDAVSRRFRELSLQTTPHPPQATSQVPQQDIMPPPQADIPVIENEDLDDPGFLELFDMIENSWMRQSAGPDEDTITHPSFEVDIEVTPEQQQQKKMPQKKKKKLTRVDKGKMIQVEENQQSPSSTIMPIARAIHNEIFLDEIMEELENDDDDVMTSKRLEKAQTKIPFQLRSSFWKKKDQLEMINAKEGLIADHDFVDYNPEELLFDDNETLIVTRKYFHSLREGVVDEVFPNIWCQKLNYTTKEDVKHIFFSTNVYENLRNDLPPKKNVNFRVNIDRELGSLKISKAELVRIDQLMYDLI